MPFGYQKDHPPWLQVVVRFAWLRRQLQNKSMKGVNSGMDINHSSHDRTKAMSENSIEFGSMHVNLSRTALAAVNSNESDDEQGPQSIGAHLVPSSSRRRPSFRTNEVKWWSKSGPSRSGNSVCAIGAAAATSLAHFSAGDAKSARPRASASAALWPSQNSTRLQVCALTGASAMNTSRAFASA